MVASRHLRLVALAVLALVLACADPHLLLTVAPALLVAALPLGSWFLGERLIVARRTRRVPPRRRPVARGVLPHPRALSSLLERSVRCERGPPVLA